MRIKTLKNRAAVVGLVAWTGGAQAALIDRGGGQSNSAKGTALHAVAVRPGDVATAVPQPQTLALALLFMPALGNAASAVETHGCAPALKVSPPPN